MRGKKFLLYDRDKRLINFLEKIALPYIRFRYKQTIYKTSDPIMCIFQN